MKTTTLFVSLLFSAYFTTNAQSVAPSTVRQIFSLEKGDSLEYLLSAFTPAPGCGAVCNFYLLNIIDSAYYNASRDTLILTFSSTIIYSDTFVDNPYACGSCGTNFHVLDYFPVYSNKWVVTNLDSSIFYLMDTLYSSLDCAHLYYDSAYIDNAQYNSSKQNYGHFAECIMDGWDETYADSLGIVYKTEYPGTAPWENEQLIYYHKANGSTWGTPFIYTGISNIANDTHISVYPNPAADRFVIQDEHYEAARFVLYDVLSKQIMNLALTGAVTTVYRNNLPAGIYCWQVIDGGNVMRVGKLVLE